MLFCKNVPTVIEPGVDALEVGLVRTYGKTPDGKTKSRTFYVAFERVRVNIANAQDLPLVATSQHPHIFSMLSDLSESLFLLVYDQYGRLSIIYTRESNDSAWTRHNATSEQVGETVTQFSVRYAFANIADRDRFVRCLDKISAGKPSKTDIALLTQLLQDESKGPIMLPIAFQLSTPTQPIEVPYGASDET